MSGKQAQGYVKNIENYYCEQVPCYEVPPQAKPYPPLKGISIERLQRMTVAGHTLKALSLRGKPLKILAQNQVAIPGKAEIFYYIIQRSSMSGPMGGSPGAMGAPGTMGSGMSMSRDEYYWFVRLPGGELQAVPHARLAFAALMAEAFADYPELATRIKQEESGARFKNMSELVAAYNAYFPTK